MKATYYLVLPLNLAKRTLMFIVGVFESLNLTNFRSQKKYSQCIVRPNSVLVVETFSTHGETLSGVIKYFQDLGYNVDIFIRHFHRRLGLAWVDNIRSYALSTWSMKKFLLSSKCNNYEFVFFNTFDSQQTFGLPTTLTVLDWLGKTPPAKYGVLGIYHNLKTLNQDPLKQLLESHRLFALNEYTNQIPLLNSNDFSVSSPTVKFSNPRLLNRKIKFLLSGRIIPKVREFPMLLETVSELIQHNYTNFEINIVGSKSPSIPSILRKRIKFLGWLKFDSFQKEVENSDFLITLLNSSNKYHQGYMQYKTTGTKQLALGFLKPLIIEKPFADIYGFDAQNAVVYTNNLTLAFERVLNMSTEEYSTMQSNLKKFRDTVRAKSLNNLQDVIKNIVTIQ
ncbi:MAG: hypothetical protein LBE20_03170 [Deltaproteobacteria bacterium]|jgi:hypothetical protein|nr:hypothetical protein [Deltaproteobacteria bacterium]